MAASSRSSLALSKRLSALPIAPQTIKMLENCLTPVLGSVNTLSTTVGALLGSKVVKIIAFLLLILNIRAFPFVWHVRIWRWAILKRIEYRAFRIRTALTCTKAQRGKLEDAWLEGSIPLGQDPCEFTSSYKTWASLDESDFNMHLSNSSYAKTLDSARFKAAVEMFPVFFRGGGWIPLAATQFHYITEIPIGASYEVRSRITAWDSKWFYMVSKFVMPANKSKKKRKATQTNGNASGNASPPTDGNAYTMANLHTPASADDVSSPAASGTATPIGAGNGASNGNASLAKQLLDAGIKINGDGTFAGAAASAQLRKPEDDPYDTEEPDGAQVHTVAISRCCLKVGRITIPPAMVFAMSGLTTELGEKAAQSKYSFKKTTGGASVKPPHWDAVRATFTRPGGNYGTFDPRTIAKFITGGWRQVEKDEDKWWDRAFDSYREENLRKLQFLQAH